MFPCKNIFYTKLKNVIYKKKDLNKNIIKYTCIVSDKE